MNIPSHVRQLVYARDNMQCQSCGIHLDPSAMWMSVQHRKARGTGGANNLANLILLCGSATSRGCHRKCEDRDMVMHDRGYWLFSWENELNIPIRKYDGVTVQLNNDGTVTPIWH